MKTETIVINTAARSKINWLALMIAAVNITAALGYIPQEYIVHVLTLVNTLGPALIMVARTWFTARQE